MNKLATALAGGLAVVAVTPAFAQDANGTFTGPRVEAILGYDMTRAGSEVDNDVDTNDDESIDGLLYGVGVGYDVGLGNAVVGVEGEFTDGTAKTRFNNGDFEGFGLGRVSTGRDFYVGARAGVLASPNTLLYVKGGYTNARFNVLASDGETELSRNFDTDGWRVGAGAERSFANNMFAKVEYRYSNYSKGEVDFENDAVGDSDRFDIDTDRHQVVASVGMRF
jgi:outer membrane immunogenic protein